ncbi:MATE family efflux transporter [Bacillus sp. 2205SS5-2]|uniref:MATE family efflux transporter n=1 Tax=Bacillus sp. 2205SS5-2 TaxID=3109031 RepID=UPI0030077CC6
MNKQQFLEVYREFSHRVITTKLVMALAGSADHVIAAMFISSGVLAALTLITPMLFFVFAFAFMFASGLSSYIGLLIGKKEIKKANQSASFIVLIFTGIALILSGVTAVNASKVASFLGATGEYHQIATTYLRFVSIAFFPQMVSIVLDGLVMNDGNPKYNFRVNMITMFMNFILNVVWVVILDYGVFGLAIATLISHSFHLLANLYYFIWRSDIIKLRKPKKNIYALQRTLYNGSSDFFGVFIEAIMLFVVNQAIINHLSGQYLEAYAASAVFTLFISKIYLGSQYGLLPVASKMMGEERYTELKQLLVFSVKRSAIYAFGFYLALIPFVWLGLPYFLEDAQFVNIAFMLYLGVGFAVVCSNIGIQSSIFFTSINRPMESLVIAIIRTLILIPIFSYTMIGWLKLSGIMMGFLVPELIISVAFYVYFKKIKLSALSVSV